MTDTVYAARDRQCGHLVAVIVDESSRPGWENRKSWKVEVAKEVADWIEQGYHAEHMELSQFQAEGLCGCDREARKKEAMTQLGLELVSPEQGK